MGTWAVWQGVIERYPEDPRSEQIRLEEAAFAEASTEDTLEGWRTLESQFPSHFRSAEIEAAILEGEMAIGFDEALQANTAEA